MVLFINPVLQLILEFALLKRVFVDEKKNLIIGGATDCGKTTLLNALLELDHLHLPEFPF
jgi:Flp pilus assembly CpaF family ATPase